LYKLHFAYNSFSTLNTNLGQKPGQPVRASTHDPTRIQIADLLTRWSVIRSHLWPW